MEMKIFDAENAIFGRIGAVAAKELLKGNSVTIVNCEKVLFSGDKNLMIAKMRAKLKMGRGSSLKGPTYVRRADLLMKRMMRGMLPWDRTKGREAYRRLRCYVGNSEDKNAVKFDHQKPQRHFEMKELVGALK